MIYRSCARAIRRRERRRLQQTGSDDSALLRQRMALWADRPSSAFRLCYVDSSFSLNEVRTRPVFPFSGGSSQTFAPVLPPLLTCPICSSGALLKAKIDSSRSTASFLAPGRTPVRLGPATTEEAAPRLSSMFASPIEKLPCCGSSASNQVSRRWFIIAVSILKCTACAQPSLSGLGLSLPSIAGA